LCRKLSFSIKYATDIKPEAPSRPKYSQQAKKQLNSGCEWLYMHFYFVDCARVSRFMEGGIFRSFENFIEPNSKLDEITNLGELQKTLYGNEARP
jgi:hypothetical protein